MFVKNRLRRGRPGATRRSLSRGVALIEALVAMLLFSIGILAAVGLHAAMVKNQTNTSLRSDASNLASEAIGVMWSDAANVALYAGDSCAAHARCRELQDKAQKRLPAGVLDISLDGVASTVVVRWTPPHDGTHAYATSTVILK